jgi:hypothetical protein
VTRCSKVAGTTGGRKAASSFSAFDQHRVGQPAAQNVGEAPDPCREQRAQHVGLHAQHAEGIVAHLGAAHPGAVAGADDGTDGGAGDLTRADAEFVERLDHHDMGEALGAAAAEHQGEIVGRRRMGRANG